MKLFWILQCLAIFWGTRVLADEPTPSPTPYPTPSPTPLPTFNPTSFLTPSPTPSPTLFPTLPMPTPLTPLPTNPPFNMPTLFPLPMPTPPPTFPIYSMPPTYTFNPALSPTPSPVAVSFTGCFVSQALPYDSYSISCNETDTFNPNLGRCHGFNKTSTVSTCSVNTTTTPIAFSCDTSKIIINLGDQSAQVDCKVIPGTNNIARLSFPCTMPNAKGSIMNCLIPTNLALPSPHIPNANSTTQSVVSSVTNTETSTTVSSLDFQS